MLDCLRTEDKSRVSVCVCVCVCLLEYVLLTRLRGRFPDRLGCRHRAEGRIQWRRRQSASTGWRYTTETHAFATSKAFNFRFLSKAQFTRVAACQLRYVRLDVVGLNVECRTAGPTRRKVSTTPAARAPRASQWRFDIFLLVRGSR